MSAPTAARPTTRMLSDRFVYFAEQWDHGVVLTVTPIQQGGLHAGFTKITETTNVATVFSVYDALMVARLHAQAHGATQPLLDWK